MIALGALKKLALAPYLKSGDQLILCVVASNVGYQRIFQENPTAPLADHAGSKKPPMLAAPATSDPKRVCSESASHPQV
jgi:hypothetical protein